MTLNIVWFVLIVVLFTGFFILEGFDYGVGMLLVGKSDSERSMLIRSIGPVWDANEVWMITAGGALFAAFPHAYATIFSTFYLALFLMLLALILRAVAFELRSKYPALKWRQAWDCAIIFGSTVPALLWGVAIANLLQGLPIDPNFHYLGSFFDLLSPYTLLTGLTFVAIFLFHGAAFLMLRIADERLLLSIKRQGAVLGIAAIAFYFAFLALSMHKINFVFALLALLYAFYAFFSARFKVAFISSTVSIAALTIAFFASLFPNIMVSSLDPDWSLNILNAASTPHTLAIMTGAAVVLVPIVLIYQAWSYKIFKQRVTANDLYH